MSKTQDDLPTVSEQDGIRYLHFDSPWVQGAMSLKKPARLVLSYTEQMMAWLLFLAPSKERVIGQLGLGAGSLARFCHRQLPNPQVVVERNAAVIRTCGQYFRLPIDPRLKVIEADAGRWVTLKANQASLAVLMVDLYDAHAQGPVCDSAAFYAACAQTLESPGILVVNLFGHHSSFTRNLAHLSAAFDSRLVLMPPVQEGNQIVLAFKGPPMHFSRLDLFARADAIERQYQLPGRRWARALSNIHNV